MAILKGLEKLNQAAVPFQVEDAARVIRLKKSVLGHKTGLGKTFISLLALSQIESVNRIFVIGTQSAIGVWRRKLKEWCDVDSTILVGNDPRWKEASDKRNSGIWLCTYATARILLLKDYTGKKIPVDALICDELHKALRSRNKTWDALRTIQCDYFFGLTATWASKGPQDLWPILNYIDPKLFPSYWRYVNTWCFVEETSYGKEIIGVKNADKLKALLSHQFYTVRTWKEVGSQFRSVNDSEPVVRRTEIVPMSPGQILIHEGMYTRMECEWQGDVLLAQNSLDKLTRLLQIATSPRLLFPKGPVGGPIEWLTEQLSNLQSAVVFVPYKGLVQIAADHLRASGYEGKLYNLYGGLSLDTVDATIQAWKRTKGVIFCTISFAQSFELDISEYAYCLGFDWDPNNNIQAEGRLRRLDTILESPCLITYIVPEGSEYERVKEVINGKVADVKKVLASYAL